MKFKRFLDALFNKLLSPKTKEKSEQAILWIALGSFITHLIIIGLVHFNIIYLAEPSNLLKNPIAAIYTPFSFILVYEVYLLIYYLPKSTSIYIAKQYEIITLIIIRRLFKDLSGLSLSANWFSIKNDLQFTYDLIASLILFYLIYLFNKQRNKIYRKASSSVLQSQSVSKFIYAKKIIATFLVPVLFVTAVYSFFSWVLGIMPNHSSSEAISFKNINNIFFEQFFNILIMADVTLLLFSFFHTDEFHKVIRNSGFIISTILIRISFASSGIINNLLIITAIVFGLLVFIIHNKFEKQLALEAPQTTDENDL